jgi:hypothetical protein
MNYQRAFREALAFFPTELLISNSDRQKGEEAKSRTLADAWARAEELTGSWSVWHQLAVWSIGCALHRLVRLEGTKGAISANKHMLDRKYAEFKFAESLLSKNRWFPGHIKRAYKRNREQRGLPRFEQQNRNYEG